MSDRPPPLSSWIALNAFNVFMAGVQTGFGPFLPVYLARDGWSQETVGFTLSLGAIASVISQVPAGVLVDQVQQKRLVCAGSLCALGLAALVLAFWPSLTTVWAAQILHAFAAAVLTPAIAALTLGLSGHGGFRRARRQQLALCLARQCGSGGSARRDRLPHVRPRGLSGDRGHDGAGLSGAMANSPRSYRPAAGPSSACSPRRSARRGPWQVFFELRMHKFALCVAMFTLANAAMLPIALNALAAAHKAAGACDDWLHHRAAGGRRAVRALAWPGGAALGGRRPILILGFLALPIRGLLLATQPGAGFLIAIEVLDGVSAAVMGVMIPLTAADLTRSTGYLNLAIGSFGLAASLGATVSTTLAGIIAGTFGLRVAFLALSAAGAAALLVLLLVMPETGRAEAQPAAGQPVRYCV